MKKLVFLLIVLVATTVNVAAQNNAAIDEQILNENLTGVEDYFRQDFIYSSSDEPTMLKSSDFCIVYVRRNGVPHRAYFNFLKKDGKVLHFLVSPHMDYTRTIKTVAGIYRLTVSAHGVNISRQNLDLSIGQYGGISIKGDKISCEKL